MVAILMALTIITLLWHMKLGVQVVIEDYIHAPGAKLASLLLNTFFTAAMGVAALFAILKMSFGP
jgi:succinate dehydrogenase / fumarate reductase membrane anchor subunit